MRIFKPKYFPIKVQLRGITSGWAIEIDGINYYGFRTKEDAEFAMQPQKGKKWFPDI